MRLAPGIQRHGFRKWYERELMKSHGHMTLTFICAIGVFAAIEAASSFTTPYDRLLDAGALLLFAGVGIWSMRRYLYLLNHAEFVAHQADCPGCGSYGRFTLVDPVRERSDTEVCCRQCQRRWTIHE